MKYLKMLGLAAIAALGLLAFVGAGTASATTLFTDSAKTIKYPKGTTIHGSLVSGTSARLTSGGTEIATCTQTTLQLSTASETGTTINGNVSSWTLGGCNQTTHAVALGAGDIEYTSGSSGKVIGTGNQVTMGIFGTSCTYGTGAGTVLGTLTGGSAPVLKVNTTIPRVAGGFLCPSSGVWEAEYVITTPHALYVGA
ncbi:MAG: hypothetical protein M3335_09510 [Actinomycetota bacterium]|nr:hypothetical protein [Actinomycetota bacterium]